MSKKKVKFSTDPDAAPPKERGRLFTSPRFRIIFFALTAILLFILVVAALVSTSYVLFFFGNNPTCGTNPNSKNTTMNANIFTMAFAILCFFVILIFAILLIQRRVRRRRKNREEEEEEEEEENVEEETEAEQQLDPAKMQKMLQDLPFPTSIKS